MEKPVKKLCRAPICWSKYKTVNSYSNVCDNFLDNCTSLICPLPLLGDRRVPWSSMCMLLLLRPPTKQGYHDVTMHALYFLSRGRCKTPRWECPTCDKEREEGKGFAHPFFILGPMIHFPFSFYRDKIFQYIMSQPKAGQNTQRRSTWRAGRNRQPTNKVGKVFFFFFITHLGYPVTYLEYNNTL